MSSPSSRRYYATPALPWDTYRKSRNAPSPRRGKYGHPRRGSRTHYPRNSARWRSWMSDVCTRRRHVRRSSQRWRRWSRRRRGRLRCGLRRGHRVRRARKFRSGGGGRGSCRIRDGRGSGQETFSSGLQDVVCVTILRSRLLVLAFATGPAAVIRPYCAQRFLQQQLLLSLGSRTKIY